MMTIEEAAARLDRSTCEQLAFHARETPEAVAIVDGARAWTFRALAGQVAEAADWLGGAGAEPGEVVGIEAPDRHVHLVLLLACEMLGATAMSLLAPELAPPFEMGRYCDRVVTISPGAGTEPGRHLALTSEQMRRIVSAGAAPSLASLERRPRPESLARLIKSSGTTGVPKVMGMTHRVQQRIIQHMLCSAGPRLLHRAAFLCIYRFTVRAANTRALLTLQLGGTVHLVGSDSLWGLLEAGIGDHVLFLAGDLDRFVRTARPGRGPFDLHVHVIGAEPSHDLRLAARASLSRDIVVSYSSNEAHRIAMTDDDGVGTVPADVRVMVVDRDGRPAPPGARGMIRVMNDTMTDGYIGAPELTRASFVEGWYQTGDIGFQPAPGKLVVLGRADDMMNIGGVKVSPGPIETRLKAIAGVHDALATCFVDERGDELLLVAIETGPAPSSHLWPTIEPILAAYADRYRLIAIEKFPRTETGKVRRDAIRQAGGTARAGPARATAPA